MRYTLGYMMMAILMTILASASWTRLIFDWFNPFFGLIAGTFTLLDIAIIIYIVAEEDKDG